MIYWDYNATSPLRPLVKKRVAEALEKYPGNASSSHAAGQEARAYIEQTRRKFAQALKVDPTEIIFTGSATEANMMAIWGFWYAQKQKDQNVRKILATSLEHASVPANIDFLVQNEGVEVIEMPLTECGLVDLEATRKLLESDQYWLCTLCGASNETGIIQPWQELSKLCAEFNTPFHTDLVQFFGRLDLDLSASEASSATLAFHKSGGLKAIGAFYLRRGSNWVPTVVGGAQEKKRRAGTENILGIASIDALLDELDEMLASYHGKILQTRDRFEQKLKEALPEAKIAGTKCPRLPNTSFCIFPGIQADEILMSLDVHDICASAGSACSSGLSLPSSQLLALGYSEEDAQAGIRFSLGESCEPGQIEQVVDTLVSTIERIKKRKTSS